jgi:hypothetical protein
VAREGERFVTKLFIAAQTGGERPLAGRAVVVVTGGRNELP